MENSHICKNIIHITSTIFVCIFLAFSMVQPAYASGFSGVSDNDALPNSAPASSEAGASSYDYSIQPMLSSSLNYPVGDGVSLSVSTPASVNLQYYNSDNNATYVWNVSIPVSVVLPYFQQGYYNYVRLSFYIPFNFNSNNSDVSGYFSFSGISDLVVPYDGVSVVPNSVPNTTYFDSNGRDQSILFDFLISDTYVPGWTTYVSFNVNFTVSCSKLSSSVAYFRPMISIGNSIAGSHSPVVKSTVYNGSLVSFLTNINKSISDGFSTLFTSLSNFDTHVSGQATILRGQLETFQETVSSDISTQTTKINQMLSTGFAQINAQMNSNHDDLVSKMGGWYDGLTTTINLFCADMITQFNNWFSELLTTMATYHNQLVDILTNTSANSQFDQANDDFKEYTDNVDKLQQNVYDTVTDAIGDDSIDYDNAYDNVFPQSATAEFGLGWQQFWNAIGPFQNLVYMSLVLWVVTMITGLYRYKGK